MKMGKSKEKINSMLIFLALLMVMFLFTPGCGVQTRQEVKSDKSDSGTSQQQKRSLCLDNKQSQVVVYFANDSGQYLIPVTLPITPTEKAAEVAIQKLLAGPPVKNLQPTIPAGTKLRKLLRYESIAYIDLTGEIENVSGKNEAKNALESLLLTVTEFPGINNVIFLVEGEKLDNLKGVSVKDGMIRPPGPNYDGAINTSKAYLTLYFTDKNAMYLVPVTTSVPEGSTEILARTAVVKLLKGPPPDSGLGRTIWPGTALRSLKLEEEENRVVLELSGEAIAYGGGHTAESLLVNSLVFTLTEIPGISSVQLSITNGNERKTLPEGTDIALPLKRPKYLNYINDRNI